MDEWTVIYDGSWQVVDVSDKRFGGQIIICDCGGDPWSEMNARNIAAAHNRSIRIARIASKAVHLAPQ